MAKRTNYRYHVNGRVFCVERSGNRSWEGWWIGSDSIIYTGESRKAVLVEAGLI
jgi:hypothetical protein